MNNLKHLHIQDEIRISLTRYTVVGMIQFSEGGYSWTEYKLRSESGDIEWLSVDEDGSQASLFKSVTPKVKTSADSVSYETRNYDLQEQGSATVSQCEGNVDVDLHETVHYYEYADNFGRNLFSLEDWDGDIENSVGHTVPIDDIRLSESSSSRSGVAGGHSTNRRNDYDSRHHKESNTNWMKWVFGGTVVFILLLFVFNILAKAKDVDKFMDEDPNFSYVTSITADSTSIGPAKVYKSELSVRKTADYLIAKVRPREHSDLNNSETASLLYKNSYVFIYQGEDEETLVQYSTREYTYRSNNSLYRSRRMGYGSIYRDYYFYRAWRHDSSRYSRSSFNNYKPANTASSLGTVDGSVRQSSSGSRNSIGGGTSFGK